MSRGDGFESCSSRDFFSSFMYAFVQVKFLTYNDTITVTVKKDKISNVVKLIHEFSSSRKP